jgi:D-tyrosyl-tRNA(Tyr) deacylase
MRRLASMGSPPTLSPGTVMPHSAWASRRALSPSTDSRYPATASTAAIAPEYARVRALVQRVTDASVTVDGEEVSRIGPGLLVLLGVQRGDGPEQADRIASKLLALRVFEDAEGKMNLSVRDVGGEVLCVSQFTLYGDTRKGNRPSFVDAAPPDEAEPLYERVRNALGAKGGVFGARMAVALVNDGPVTLMLE